MTDLNGMTVVVTGASRGIGEATARHFATLGATVILAARNQSRIETIARDIVAGGGQAFAIRCDVSKAEDVTHLINTTMSETERLDLLVNNAGLIDPIARLADSDPISWSRIVDTNLKGVYFGLRFAIPAMLAHGRGTIINISSGAATSALEGWSHYCSTKAAVLSLTGVADKEYREHGIRVIGLSPGTVATEMQVKIKESDINPVSKLDVSDHIPPEWVARAIRWLCTADADGYRGQDFSLKTNEGREAIGLEPVSQT